MKKCSQNTPLMNSSDSASLSLGEIAGKFSSGKDIGPKFCADFEEADDPEKIERIKRDAFERVNAVLLILGMR